MLRTIKTAMAATLVLAMAACSNVTAPVVNEVNDAPGRVSPRDQDIDKVELPDLVDPGPGSGGGGDVEHPVDSSSNRSRPNHNGRNQDLAPSENSGTGGGGGTIAPGNSDNDNGNSEGGDLSDEEDGEN